MKPSALISHTTKMAERCILHFIVYAYLEDMYMDQGHLRHRLNNNEIVAFDIQVIIPSFTTVTSSSSRVVVDGQALIPFSFTIHSSSSQFTIDGHAIMPLSTKSLDHPFK